MSITSIMLVFIFVPFIAIACYVLYATLGRKYRLRQIASFGNHATGTIIKTKKAPQENNPENKKYLHFVSFDDCNSRSRTGECLDITKANVGDVVYLRYLPYEKKLIVIEWDDIN